MFRQFFLSLVLLVFSFLGYSQYYTNAQITTINTNKTAREGDLYLDTLGGKYYIGLTNGTLSQINTDSTVVNGIINQKLEDSLKGTIFPIWAEESAALNSNSFEWSYGNGDDAQANFGIAIPVECELFAVGLTLFDGTAEVEVYQNGLGTGATTGTGGVGTTINTLATPIAFHPGDNLNFRTLNTSGAGNGGKVVAWMRITSKIPSYDRFNGSGAPSVSVGNDDDEYLDIITGDLYIKESGAWNFKLNIKGPSGTITNKSIIQVTNTVSGNINQTAGLQFSWIDVAAGNIQTNDPAGFTVATDGVTINGTGLYKLTVFQYQEGTSGARNNASVRFTINGTEQSGIGANSYQRLASGHDESTASLVKIVSIASGDKVGIRNVAIADNGNVTCPAGTLVFIVEQL